MDAAYQFLGSKEEAIFFRTCRQPNVRDDEPLFTRQRKEPHPGNTVTPCILITGVVMAKSNLWALVTIFEVYKGCDVKHTY